MTAAGLVLAAGLGRRFGGDKLLALFRGRPLLQHVLDAAETAGLEPVIVVLGPDASDLQAAIDWRRERRVVNPDAASGIASSLRAGVRELAGLPLVQTALVLLGDQPLVDPAAVARLANEPVDPAQPVLVPRYADGRPGNPVRIDRSAWPLAYSLTADAGMRAVIAARPDLVRYVDLAGTNPDVDTPVDLARLNRDAGPGRSSRTAAVDRSRPSRARPPRT